MVNPQASNMYKSQQITTASSEQLTLLLYNGALRFLNESILALEQRDLPRSHQANLRVQDIVHEFVRTLDMSYEISQSWVQLYEYTEYCLIQGNIKKDVDKLYQAKSILQEMRDAWEGAMKQAYMAQTVAR